MQHALIKAANKAEMFADKFERRLGEYSLARTSEMNEASIT